MAGQLIQVATNTVSSAVASVTLTGIDSDDVYLFTFNNVIPETADADLLIRFTESGTANTTSNYDRSAKLLRSDTTFSNTSATNESQTNLSTSMENDNNTGGCNGLMYVYNANNSSEYTFATRETVYLAEDGTMLGFQGGNVFTVTSAVDGVQFRYDTGNIRSGAVFTLYKVL